jgi:RNase P subunit RPR2
MSEPRWERKGILLDGSAKGRYSHQVNVVAENSAFQCVRCQHTEKVQICSNCESPWFTGGFGDNGEVGLKCMRCNLVQTRWTCPQCGANNAVVNSFGELKTGMCFIATAAFENMQAPEVIFLRTFRDNTLAKYAFGRGFIRAYQTLSPPFAAIVSRSVSLKRVSRSVLRIIVKALSK